MSPTSRRAKIIGLIEPLLGFEQMERFVILQKQGGPDVLAAVAGRCRAGAFCLLAPFQDEHGSADMAIGPDGSRGCRRIGRLEITVYTLVVLDDDRDKIRTNLRAPILVNHTAGKAKQVIFDIRGPARAILPQRSAEVAGCWCSRVPGPGRPSSSMAASAGTVLGIDRNGQVRLGIEAPKECRILRSELVEEVKDANRGALIDPARRRRSPGLSVGAGVEHGNWDLPFHASAP